jgi:hypothetical protein
MRQIVSGPDIRYGDVKIMQTDVGQMLFCVRTRIFQDEASWKTFEAASRKEIERNEKSLIKLLDLQHMVQSEMCSSVTRCYLLYEYYPFDLRKDISDL